MPVKGITDTPSGPSGVGAAPGEDGEVYVYWDDFSDNGEYRVQLREQGLSSWDPADSGVYETTVGEGITEALFDGLPSNTTHEARVRAETAHAQTAWSSLATSSSTFSGVSSFGVDSHTATSVSMSWSDDSGSEAGFRVRRRRMRDGEWTAWETVADLGPNTTSYTDDTPVPATQYEYFVVAYTEYSASPSGGASVTTDSLGFDKKNRPGSDGWWVEIEHSNGSLHHPSILGEPQRNPTVNGLPSVTVQVPWNEKWNAGGFTDADAVAYKDGERQPVDTLVDVGHEEGQRERRMTLELRGGSELLERVQASYELEDVDQAMRDLVGGSTSYATNVDSPDADIQTDVPVQQADTEQELQTSLAEPLPATSPLHLDSGNIDVETTCWFQHSAESYDDDPAFGVIREDTRFTNGRALAYGDAWFSWSWEVGYDVDEDNLKAAVLFDKPPQDEEGRPYPGFYVDVNGTRVTTNDNVDWLQPNGGDIRSWLDFSSETAQIVEEGGTVEIRVGSNTGLRFYEQDENIFSSDFSGGIPGEYQVDLDYPDDTFEDHWVLQEAPDQDFEWWELQDGEHYDWDNSTNSVTVYEDGLPSDSENFRIQHYADCQPLLVDAVAMYDDRYDHSTQSGSSDGNWTETVDSNQQLPEPARVPESLQVEFDDATPGFKIVGALAEVDQNDQSGAQQLALSFDGGSTWTTADNTGSIEATGQDASSVRLRATISRYGQRDDETPTTGYLSQNIYDYQLYADLDNTPIVVSRDFDDRLVNVLENLAREKNFVWEVRHDGDAWSFEACQPGQRTSSEGSEVIQYRINKQTRDRVEKATIKGSAQNIRRETFNSAYDSYVNLNQENLVTGGEVVYSAGTDEQFVRGTDYEIDALHGRIKVLSTGAMSDSTTYSIDYRYKVKGSYSADGVSDPVEIVKSVPGLNSDQTCEQLAYRVVEKGASPIWEAEMVVPKQPVGWNVIDKIDPEGLPGDGLQIRNIEEVPESLHLTMASRRTVGEYLRDVRGDVEAVSRKV